MKNNGMGLSTSQREALAKMLSKLLADTYTLYLKTQNFHWNVTGPYFSSLHTLFQTQYEALAIAIDNIAERIRALDFPAPGSYQQFAKLTSISEETQVISWNEMVQKLLWDHESLAANLRQALPLCEETQDEVTLNLVDDLMEGHEKAAWMLRSLLK